jgi:hypothetical protein
MNLRQHINQRVVTTAEVNTYRELATAGGSDPDREWFGMGLRSKADAGKSAL